MQIKEHWKVVHTIHEQNIPVYAVAIKPEEKQLLASDGARLNIYDLTNGTLIANPKRHRNVIYAIACSTHDPYFATAGTDDTVIIWNSKENKGIVKFTITGSASSLSFSPTAPKLLACAGTEISLWHPQIKQVVPISTSSKILCSAWSPDGKTYAIGHINGTISVRNVENSQEIYTYHLQVPVFACAWSNELLLAGDWDNKLTVHKPRESQLVCTQNISAQPSTMINFQSNLLVTDIAGKVTLYNDDGQLLSEVLDTKEWIWSASVSSSDGYLALGLDNGTLAVYSLGMKPVYSLFNSSFAIRTELTKIQLRILETDLVEDVEFIKPVQGVAVTDHQVAVRFSDEVSAYEFDDINGHLELTKIGRFDTNFNCTKFFVFSGTFLFVFEKSIKIFTQAGAFQREFNFSSTINDAAICSTVLGMEGIVAGFEDGQIVQLFVNHRFPHVIVRHDKPIRSIGISRMKTKIYVIDSEHRCCVYDAISSALLYIEENVNEAAWNDLCDDLIAFSDGERINVKPYDLQRVTTKFKGHLIRFSGLTCYTINNSTLSEIDISLSTVVKSLSRNGDFVRAYELATFGSTEESWNELANAALRSRFISIAIKSASHSRNYKLLQFIDNMSQLLTDTKFTQDHLNAEIDAYTNNFDSAARIWMHLGENERAVQMYFDLRQFDKLKQFLSGERMKKFALTQAESFQSMGDLELAAELYIIGGESLKAVKLLNEAKLIEPLIKISKKIEPTETEALQYAADALMKHDLVKEATDLLAQLDDVSSLAKVRVYTKDWDEALSLAKMHPSLLPEVFLPFARHLFENEQYFESLVSFFIAGRVDEALKYLKILLSNAIKMNRYDNVAFFLYGRSLGLASISESPEEGELIVESGMQLAKAYSAFGRLKEDLNSPFTINERGSSFYLSRFVVAYINSIRKGEFKDKYLHSLSDELISGISYSEALFSLLNESENMGEYRLMKWCAEQLALYVVPPAVQEAVDFAILRTSGLNDDEETEFCERCGSRLFSSSDGPLLWCSECKCPIVFSSYSFKVIQLVPVKINGLEESEIETILKSDPPIDGTNVDVGDIIDPSRAVDGEECPVVGADNLKKIEPSSIITCKWKSNAKVKNSYILNPLLESVHRCRGCNSIFNDEDFELTFLENGCCPICKTPLDYETEGEFSDTIDSYSDLLKQLRSFADSVPIDF
ncbi:intraflagellar transport protein [Histomonas meleagridis]|uniref:intraflagellar transport protein n=1 Tax=Histomonas meleagridis TaxID=135588 RepID=UPI0035598988|nr:intraflagellar transport protein [Histomonas meleagridis]KAH0797504.1 intraflagellar transport protein [Histomonas meleagridis]